MVLVVEGVVVGEGEAEAGGDDDIGLVEVRDVCEGVMRRVRGGGCHDGCHRLISSSLPVIYIVAIIIIIIN